MTEVFHVTYLDKNALISKKVVFKQERGIGIQDFARLTKPLVMAPAWNKLFSIKHKSAEIHVYGTVVFFLLHDGMSTRML